MIARTEVISYTGLRSLAVLDRDGGDTATLTIYEQAVPVASIVITRGEAAELGRALVRLYEVDEP